MTDFHAFDEGTTALSRQLPPAVHSMYESFRDSGFTDGQSLVLALAYFQWLLGAGGGRVP